MKTTKVKTKNLVLSAGEILHLRDLLSIKPSPTQTETISELLATALDRTMAEESLYVKICELCIDLSLPIEEEAPTYSCMLAELPKMSVVMVNNSDEVEEIEFNSGDELSEENDTEEEPFVEEEEKVVEKPKKNKRKKKSLEIDEEEQDS